MVSHCGGNICYEGDGPPVSLSVEKTWSISAQSNTYAKAYNAVTINPINSAPKLQSEGALIMRRRISPYRTERKAHVLSRATAVAMLIA